MMLEIQIQFVSNGRRIATLEELANLVADKGVQRIAPQLKQLPTPVPAAISQSSLVQQPKGDSPVVKLVTVATAAKLLGISRSTLWKYVAEKRVETIHIGLRSTRIRMETIDRIVSEGMPRKKSK